MTSSLHEIYATDKDIFDLMMSARQRLTSSVLLDLARDRRIYMAPSDPRESIVAYLSTLVHDSYDIESLLERGGASRRAEKTASVVIAAELTADEIRAALRDYERDANGSEKVILPPRAKGVAANIAYSEFDLSRTTLVQRQEREADLEFTIEAGQTTIRFPATPKASEIVADVTSRIEAVRKSALSQARIEVSSLTTAEARTQFFLSLITQIPDFKLDDVTSLKVAPWAPSGEFEDIESVAEAAEAAEKELLVIVRKVALSGQNLMASEQYQQLRQGGFYITFMRWRATQQVDPWFKVQFDAGFDDGEAGTGFRYMVRYAERSSNGSYPQHMKKVQPALRERELFVLLESTAQKVLGEIS